MEERVARGGGERVAEKEIDFEHETIGGIGKGARDGVLECGARWWWGGGMWKPYIPIFGLLFSAPLMEQASFQHLNRNDKTSHIFHTNINFSIKTKIEHVQFVADSLRSYENEIHSTRDRETSTVPPFFSFHVQKLSIVSLQIVARSVKFRQPCKYLYLFV